ncbi:MAG: hypothetical protein LBT46_11495 [Planctomycetaceae bacterium]|nr:hypothetical protein [Planctomycetaceae bacterium]
MKGRKGTLQTGSQAGSQGSQAAASHGSHAATSQGAQAFNVTSLALRFKKKPPKGRNGLSQTVPQGSQTGSHGSQAACSQGWQAAGSQGLQTTESRPNNPASAVDVTAKMTAAQAIKRK